MSIEKSTIDVHPVVKLLNILLNFLHLSILPSLSAHHLENLAQPFKTSR